MAFGYRESIGEGLEYSVSGQYLFTMLKVSFPNLTYKVYESIIENFSVHMVVMQESRNKISQIQILY